jgi:hypothetical protein
MCFDTLGFQGTDSTRSADNGGRATAVEFHEFHL